MNNALSSLPGDNANYFPGNAQPHPGDAACALVSMNEVVQYHLISRRQQIEAMQAIIRFDALPHVTAGREVISKMISLIFNSILDYPPAGTKLLIYIKCEPEKSEVMDLSLPEGFQQFVISVYTNIITDEAWQQEQQQPLAELQALVEGAAGSCSHYHIAKTGCLYNLLLPGKLL